jgi:hypothetical protein
MKVPLVIPEYQSTGPRGKSRHWRGILIIQIIQMVVIVGGAAALFQTLLAILIAFGQLIVVSGLQWLLLLPIVPPRIERMHRKGPVYWLSASVLGLLMGMLACGVVGLIGDYLWWLDLLETYEGAMAQTPVIALASIAVGVFLVTWCIMTPLLVTFLKKGSPEQRLVRIASALFIGTVVEALSAVGILAMISRKSSCVCATFSFAALLFAFGAGFVVFGPAVLLLVIWRRSRFRPGGLCPVCGGKLGRAEFDDQCPHCGAGWKTASVSTF